MADAPYLIALALLEQNGQRAMPLQGKSLRDALPADADPGEEGRRQVLELLVRVWQRSEQAPLRRAAGSVSLLLAAVPMTALMEALPSFKAQWIATGDTEALLRNLQALGAGVWSLALESRGPLHYERIC